MDKKTGIILGIIGALVVILVGVVFVMDANTPKLDKDTLLVIEGENYTIQEFKNFAKVFNHEEKDDINYKMTEDETLTMMDEFLLNKVYYNAALKHNIKLESGDVDSFSSDYDKDAEKFTSASISKDYYIKYRTEKALSQDLELNIDDYYTLPDDIYDEVKASFDEQNLNKTYSFRLMTIPYEAPKSGDISGDVSGDVDVLEETESGDKEDLSRDAQFAVAEDVLAKLKSGDSFETLSKEYGSTRFTFKGTEYTLINGELEYATSPVLEGKLGNKKLYDAILTMNSGDLSEIIEDEEYTSFNIIKLESVEDGFVGEGEKELKSIILSENADNVIAGHIHFEMNQAAYLKSLYK